jgi:hypothetical protein
MGGSSVECACGACTLLQSALQLFLACALSPLAMQCMVQLCARWLSSCSQSDQQGPATLVTFRRAYVGEHVRALQLPIAACSVPCSCWLCWLRARFVKHASAPLARQQLV